VLAVVYGGGFAIEDPCRTSCCYSAFSSLFTVGAMAVSGGLAGRENGPGVSEHGGRPSVADRGGRPISFCSLRASRASSSKPSAFFCGILAVGVGGVSVNRRIGVIACLIEKQGWVGKSWIGRILSYSPEKAPHQRAPDRSSFRPAGHWL